MLARAQCVRPRPLPRAAAHGQRAALGARWAAAPHPGVHSSLATAPHVPPRLRSATLTAARRDAHEHANGIADVHMHPNPWPFWRAATRRHRHLASTLRVFHAISMPAEAKRALLGRTYMVGAGEGGGAQHGGAHGSAEPVSAEAFAMTRWAELVNGSRV